jgi:acetoin utilization deacetylase AcuC-like enzyme
MSNSGLLSPKEKAQLKDLILSENEEVQQALSLYEMTGSTNDVVRVLSSASSIASSQENSLEGEKENDESFAQSIDGLVLNIGSKRHPVPSGAAGRERVRLPKSPSHRAEFNHIGAAHSAEARSERALKADILGVANISDRYASSSSSSQSTVKSLSPADSARSLEAIACSSSTPSPRNGRRSRTGVVFDPRMCLHKSAKHPHHEECPERILDIYNEFNACGLWDQFVGVPSRIASPEELALAHNKAHCKDMAKLSKASHRSKREEELWSDSVYCNEHTYFAATLSAGSLLSLVDSVCSDDDRVRNGIALIRPPGHHAEHNQAMGFCIFNNCAVAARYAQQKFGLERILIVDWDIHHGNGLQNIFIDDPSVLYFSVHRYDNGSFYPGGKAGGPGECGTGDGEGYNVNVGWNARMMGDQDYLAAWMHVLMPIAYEYDPQLVIIAAGFDAAEGDPLGKCCVSPAGYSHLLYHLSSLAEGKVIVALEGGYNLKAVSRSSVACAKVLLGHPLPPIKGGVPRPSAMRSIRQTIEAHEHYWYGVGGVVEKKKSAGLSKRERLLLGLGITLENQMDDEDDESSERDGSRRSSRLAPSNSITSDDSNASGDSRRSSRTRKKKQVFDL